MKLEGARYHRCEDCDEVFCCELCTKAMNESLDKRSHFSTIIYARPHEPAYGLHRSGPIKPWLCDGCERKVERKERVS